MAENCSEETGFEPAGVAAPNDATSLSRLYEAAVARAAAGDLPDALRLGHQLLAACTETYGDEHPETLGTAILVASWRLTGGDVSGGLDMIRHLVPVATRVIGAEHPSTVAARHTLATGEMASGLSPAEALPMWVTLYGDEQRVLGLDHQCTLSSRHQIGELRRRLGDRIGARDELTGAARDTQRVLGDENPDGLAVQLAAAVCLAEAGDTVEATTELDRMIPVLNKVLGYDHRSTLLARHTRLLCLPPPGEGGLLDRVSDWELLVDDEIRALGEDDELAAAGRATLEEQRAAWRDRSETLSDVANELLIEFEIEDTDSEWDPDRPWGDPGSLDEDGKAHVSEGVATELARLDDALAIVIAAKKAVLQAFRDFGDGSASYLGRRYELAHTLWRVHEFEAARAWTDPLITECVALLGEDHPLTEAARSLLVVIDQRLWWT